MRHWTPNEIRELLKKKVHTIGSIGKLSKISKCDRANLQEAIAGRRQIPRPAAKFLGFERVTAYVRMK